MTELTGRLGQLNAEIAELERRGWESLTDRSPMGESGRVVHCLREPFDVYIGRPMPRFGLTASKWANPFKVGGDGTREQVIAKYRRRLSSRPDLMAALPELRGKVLGCWCAPQPCHGDVLAALAESEAL